MNPLLIPELRELVQEKDAASLRTFLEGLHPAQAAEIIDGLPPEELSWTLEIIADKQEALIFSYLPEDLQLEMAAGVGRPQLAKLVTALLPDDRADFVRRLPPKIVEEILPLMAHAERNDIKRLLSFPEGSVGARMTTDYATVPVTMNCGDALNKIRQEAPNKETIYQIYVVNDDRRLDGVLQLRDLLLAKADLPVKKIIRTELVVVHADEPTSTAAELTKKYDLLAVPVVDDVGRMLGIITVDDMMDVMEKQATQDILSLGAVEPGALDKPYFDTPVSTVVRKRVGWLLLLFVAEMFTGTVLRHFEEQLAIVVALSFFIPLLIGTGGNAGSQTVSTIIRSLALKEIEAKNWLKVAMREALTGFILGLILGVVGGVRSLMWAPDDMQLAMTVGITIMAICTWANTVAAMIPVFAHRVGLDPTVLSAPLITTLVDATGLVIYFSIAMAIIARLSAKVAPPTAEFLERLKALAMEAPENMKPQLQEMLPKPAEHGPGEWLYPLIALMVLGGVFYMMSRTGRKHGMGEGK